MSHDDWTEWTDDLIGRNGRLARVGVISLQSFHLLGTRHWRRLSCQRPHWPTALRPQTRSPLFLSRFILSYPLTMVMGANTEHSRPSTA
ncbi:hypothetical protein BU24DRAFT_180606 [Aaosphaeria arxii CBS 175.79]|uniref:Uncharacterized protein n=1 Tax=Aaosphaeria arxii CBS 175.79 TaxID=1450172 RepID=A0A6A5XS35_9PLEO|nr:uncharacterized protein BU24DRAFT_180606 [Aaosphaeria arxii CBS 175.79]KAF2015571.1 hypothetical protein BU24DRAFT_180606 [Aaosphaeria arxii CBS 175.79]